MSFPRYSAYKESKNDWVAHVPEHWELMPCRGFVDERTEKNEDAACQSYLSLMANVGIIPYEEKGDIGNKKPEDLSKCKIVYQGDFVINSMNYGIGSYGVSAYEGVCSPVYIVLTPRQAVVEPRFAFRIFEDKRFQAYAQSLGNGILAHRCAIGWDDLKGIVVGIPSAAEQKSILNFLDRETAKIDALIAEQRRLIELLQEKRQAVISHAVTKGLNPDAPMKDSGVEWLGEVPEHWEVLPVRRCIEARNNLRTPIDVASRLEMEGDYPYYGPTGILSHIDRFMVEGKYFLIGEDGDHFLKFERLPMSLLVLGRFNVNNHAHLLRGGPLCLTEWGALFFEHKDLQPWLIKQGIGRYKLRKEKLMEIPMTLPPLHEQLNILDAIEAQRAKSTQAKTKCSELIELLQERRSALISAAVTGQIDVRGLEQELAA